MTNLEIIEFCLEFLAYIILKFSCLKALGVCLSSNLTIIKIQVFAIKRMYFYACVLVLFPESRYVDLGTSK